MVQLCKQQLLKGQKQHMGRQAKTQRIIDQAQEILAAYYPMTVR
jgi:hypothetical protein